MTRVSSETAPTPADHQQMNRSNDPVVTAEMDAAAPVAAMTSRQGLTGSAVGVGSVAFEDPGAFDVGAGTGIDARPLAIVQPAEAPVRAPPDAAGPK